MNTVTFPYRYVHLHVQTYTIPWWISIAILPNRYVYIYMYVYIHLHVQTYTIPWWISTATFPNSNTAANLFFRTSHFVLQIFHCSILATLAYCKRWIHCVNRRIQTQKTQMNMFTVDLRDFTNHILSVDFEHFYKKESW